MCRVLLLSIVVLAGVLLGDSAHAEKRVALVVGINKYDHLPANRQLLKARNDAEAIKQALKDLGFEVVLGIDVSRIDFNRKLSQFQKTLEPGDVAAVFFAGHGIEIDRQNYLLPRDTPAVEQGEDELLIREAISVDSILSMLEKKGTRISLIILDACRDNPFADPAGRSVGGTRGLSRIDPPTGTFVMYSAGAHQKALDHLGSGDENRNSVYTRILIPLLKQSNKSIQTIAKEVQVKVKALAESVKRKQHPAYYDEIIGDFFLTNSSADRPAIKPTEQPEPKAVISVPADRPAGEAPEDREGSAKLRGEIAYLDCVRSNELVCYKSFLADFPDHARAEQVQKIIRSQIELPRFQSCMSAKTYDDKLSECHLYLDSFPNGRYRKQAEEVIEQALLDAKPSPEPPRQERSPQPEQIPVTPSRSFTTYSGYDLHGGDYSRLAGKVGYESCVSACRNDGRCKAFTYNTQAQACFLKSQVPQLSPFTNAISGVLAHLNQPNRGAAQQVLAGTCGNGFTTYNNTDFFRNDIGGYNAGFQRCRDLCLANSGCRGFSWIKRNVTQRCWLKHALSPPSTNSQVISCARN